MLDEKDYQTKINNDNYDLKNAEQLLLKIVIKKICKDEAQELIENLIEPNVVELKNAKGKSKNKRSNILTILENIKLGIFDRVYLHYLDESKLAEESIAERTKLRRQTLNMVKEKEKNINNKLFNYYFKYSSPSNMMSRLAMPKVNKIKKKFILSTRN